MGVVERYKSLISAAQRYAAGAGVKLSLDAAPNERHFPIVFRFSQLDSASPSDNAENLLFMFFPGESMLTSDVLTEVINRINPEARDSMPVLLFAEDDLRLVRRALDASGLSKHAETYSYRYHSGLFECDWIPSVQPVKPELVTS